MARYMPITGIDCLIPSLLIDTEAPLDVLHDTAAYRIRSVTQLVETLSLGDSIKGRGRNGSHLPPPAQIRTCRITAYGSCLGF